MMQQLLLSLAPRPAPTLENFHRGHNAAALAALEGALSGGERFVCLWGDAGSGRTHLLRAFIAEARSRGLPARYICAPHAGLASALGAEAIAVDDVEALEDAGQLALFDLFNAARSDRGCVVSASPCPPAELSLREDLRSRLGAGIVLRLLSLDDEEKSAALGRHAASRGLKLAPEITAYLLTHCGRDMGTQVAVLDALDRYSLEQKRPVTVPLLREALRSLDMLKGEK